MTLGATATALIGFSWTFCLAIGALNFALGSLDHQFGSLELRHLSTPGHRIQLTLVGRIVSLSTLGLNHPKPIRTRRDYDRAPGHRALPGLECCAGHSGEFFPSVLGERAPLILQGL